MSTVEQVPSGGPPPLWPHSPAAEWWNTSGINFIVSTLLAWDLPACLSPLDFLQCWLGTCQSFAVRPLLYAATKFDPCLQIKIQIVTLKCSDAIYVHKINGKCLNVFLQLPQEQCNTRAVSSDGMGTVVVAVINPVIVQRNFNEQQQRPLRHKNGKVNEIHGYFTSCAAAVAGTFLIAKKSGEDYDDNLWIFFAGRTSLLHGTSTERRRSHLAEVGRRYLSATTPPEPSRADQTRPYRAPAAS